MNPLERQRQLQENFRRMGNGQAGQSGVVANGQNMNKLNALNQIKRGAKKGEFSKFVNARPSSNTFQAIPEPKKRKNPNDKVKAEHIVKPQEFVAKSDPQLSAIESMFNGGGAGAYAGGMNMNQGQQMTPQMQQAPMTGDLNIDNLHMPSMPDPRSYLAQKNSDAYTNQMTHQQMNPQQQMMNQQQQMMNQQQQMVNPNIPQNPMNQSQVEQMNQMQQMMAGGGGQMPMQGNPTPTMTSNSPYAKFTLQGNQGQPLVTDGFMDEFHSDMAVQQQYNENVDMKTMMEQVARNIAERTVKNMLSEYSNGQNLYEVTKYKSSDGKKIIKTSDGKYYKISPVRINKGT